MAVTPLPSRSPGKTPLHRRSRRWVLRVVGAVVLTVLGILIAVGLAPFALQERRSSGSVSDTAGTLIGQVQTATEGLRGLGYSCADADVSRGVVRRVCTRVQLIESARVQLLATADTGDVQLATTTVNQARSTRASHGQILEVLADAVGLEPADRRRVLAAVAGAIDQPLKPEQSVKLGWGTLTVRSSPTPVESELRAAQWDDAPPSPSRTTLTGSVDTIAATARNRGYVCTTPELTMRACTRKEGGYSFDLSMQGTGTYLTTLYLSVTARNRTETRSRWVDEMATVLGWVDTEQGDNLSSWLAHSADAPGADSYVDGLPISFLVRADEYTKETFGGVVAECGRLVNDISGCEPELEP
jgi:hypothetical protein